MPENKLTLFFNFVWKIVKSEQNLASYGVSVVFTGEFQEEKMYSYLPKEIMIFNSGSPLMLPEGWHFCCARRM